VPVPAAVKLHLHHARVDDARRHRRGHRSGIQFLGDGEAVCARVHAAARRKVAWETDYRQAHWTREWRKSDCVVAGLEDDEDGGADVFRETVAACLAAKTKLTIAIKRNSAKRIKGCFKVGSSELRTERKTSREFWLFYVSRKR